VVAARRHIAEAELQAAVIDLARYRGWRVAPFRPARTAAGWRTPVAADGAGFPDLVLVRERLVFAELKAERGRLGPAQSVWLAALEAAGAEAHVWTPADWQSGAIDSVLMRAVCTRTAPAV